MIIFVLAIILTFVRTILVALFALFQKVYVGRKIPAALNHNPKVSILVPAYNEEKVIGNCINWLLQTTYPCYEIIVVDDGSTDGTADEVLRFSHYPQVKLIRKPNEGKASALNEGIRSSDGEILVMMDADTKFEPNTVGELVRHFEDPEIGAVSGNIKVGNRNTILTLWQSMEYIMSCNLDRRMMSILNCITVVPGPVGAFRREAIEEAGYFSSETLAEDTDMTISIRKLGYRICYEDHAVAWTEAPNDLSGLWKQRYRWSYGTLQVLWKHRDAFLRTRYGSLGMIGLPYMLLPVGLQMIAPIIDLAILYTAIFGGLSIVIIYFLLYSIMELVTAWIAFSLDDEGKWPLILLPFQRFAYRQIMYLVIMKSIYSALKGSYVGWQKLRRLGLMDSGT